MRKRMTRGRKAGGCPNFAIIIAIVMTMMINWLADEADYVTSCTRIMRNVSQRYRDEWQG
jgi:hypothetical protein